MSNKLPDINKDFAQWYNEVIYQAEMADLSPVRGCIVIRPYGYALWENIKQRLDDRIKATGHENASFPLFIPESFLKREAEHVEGFAPELAIVTHAGGKELEEPLVVRPTSETIIHHMFARWIKSWRDLPLKINHWANVVRWEMRTRPFLRTTEFFWQEGHTAHETREEADQEAVMMMDEYVDLAQNYLAIPVVKGMKSDTEKFPGAEKTYTFEALMQDGKALQMGTSHLLSQSFAHSFEMKFQDREGQQAYPHLTSWGATTRLVGAVVMTHGDEKGLVMPPRVAPIQVVIIPIARKEEDRKAVAACVDTMKQALSHVRVHVDDDTQKTPGAKFYKWELKGVPIRIEIGPRDVANNKAMIADRLGLGKDAIALEEVGPHVDALLERVHNELFARAEKRRESQWFKVAKLSELSKNIADKNGFYQTGWCGDQACEARLKEHKASTRCILKEKTFEQCFVCDKPSSSDVLVAKSY